MSEHANDNLGWQIMPTQKGMQGSRYAYQVQLAVISNLVSLSLSLHLSPCFTSYNYDSRCINFDISNQDSPSQCKTNHLLGV